MCAQQRVQVQLTAWTLGACAWNLWQLTPATHFMSSSILVSFAQQLQISLQLQRLCQKKHSRLSACEKLVYPLFSGKQENHGFIGTEP